MQQFLVSGLRSAGLSALLLSPITYARPQDPVEPDLPTQLKIMKQQLAAQRAALEALTREVHAQRAAEGAPAVGAAATAAAAPSSNEQLEAQRGTGNGQAQESSPQPAVATVQQPATAVQQPATAVQQPATAVQQPAATAVQPPAVSAAQQPAVAAVPPQATAAPQPVGAVGRPPKRDPRPPAVAPLFEQPGVLTPHGKFVLEPSLQFGYSSSNRVALVGYTVIPALLIGLIDVRETKRNTVTGALTGRIGVTNRLEAELKVPYVYRSDSAVSREVFTGTAVERVFDSSGRAVGDAEYALRYQFNDGGADKPYFIGGFRFKSRTGRDPFEVVTDCTKRCIGENITGTGLPLDLPTGSGFYSAQPSLTWLLPSDPAVFFGSISYLHNFKRRDVSRLVLNGEREFIGEVQPGGVFGFNFGFGLALNDKASFSLGYDHNSIARTRQNGVPVPGSVRVQLGTLLLGYSYRLSDKRTLNVSVGAGLTRDTPDVSLTVRVPFTF